MWKEYFTSTCLPGASWDMLLPHKNKKQIHQWLQIKISKAEPVLRTRAIYPCIQVNLRGTTTNHTKYNLWYHPEEKQFNIITLNAHVSYSKQSYLPILSQKSGSWKRPVTESQFQCMFNCWGQLCCFLAAVLSGENHKSSAITCCNNIEPDVFYIENTGFYSILWQSLANHHS